LGQNRYLMPASAETGAPNSAAVVFLKSEFNGSVGIYLECSRPADGLGQRNFENDGR
jgi:hypothetical protein